MDSLKVREMSGLVLAYLGDAVWELYIREFFIKKGLNIKNLNKIVKENVNAKKQSEFFKTIFPKLDESEKAILNRAKNGNIKTFPNSCSVIEYREATAFEAYIGLLHLTKQFEKIEKLIEILL